MKIIDYTIDQDPGAFGLAPGRLEVGNILLVVHEEMLNQNRRTVRMEDDVEIVFVVVAQLCAGVGSDGQRSLECPLCRVPDTLVQVVGL